MNTNTCKCIEEKKCCSPIIINHCCCYSSSNTKTQDVSGEGRIKLDSDLEIYVRKDGDDTNDGFTDSAGGAFLTINAAIHSLHRFNAWDNAIKIIVHEGTYEEDVVFDQSLAAVGYKTLALAAFEGEKVTITNNTTSSSIRVDGAKAIYLEGLTANIGKKIGTASCIFVKHSATVFCKNCTVSSNGLSYGFYCLNQSSLFISGTTNINLGICTDVCVIGNGAYVDFRDTVNTQNTSVSERYICVYNSSCCAATATFTGSVTGKRYGAYYNGAINTQGRGANYLPGTIAGTVATGGIYD